MNRNFSYITTGQVLGKINHLLRDNFKKINPDSDEKAPELTRSTFYRLEQRLNFPVPRTSGGWRVYSVEEEKEILKKIMKEFRL